MMKHMIWPDRNQEYWHIYQGVVEQQRKAVNEYKKRLNDAYKYADNLSLVSIKKLINLRKKLNQQQNNYAEIVEYLKQTKNGKLYGNNCIITLVNEHAIPCKKGECLLIHKLSQLAENKQPLFNGSGLLEYSLSEILPIHHQSLEKILA